MFRSMLTSSATLLVAASLLPLVLSAQSTEACRASLRNANDSVRWLTADGLVADVTYDGVTEVILWGVDDGRLVVGIVECSAGNPGRSWWLDWAAGFGSETDTVPPLEVTLENPSFGTLKDGWLWETCMGAETTEECQRLARLSARLQEAFESGGRGLRVGVPDRDGIHVYWDEARQRFESWTP
jgi:hypothetical protein